MMWLMGFSVLAVYNLLCFYLGRMVQKWLLPAIAKRYTIIYTILLIGLANSFIIGTAANVDIIRAAGAYWFALLYILVFSVPLIHLFVAVSKFSKISRRQLEKVAGILVLVIVVSVFSYGTYNAYSPVVRTYDVDLTNQSEGTKKEINIVMAADTHFGMISNKRHAEQMVNEINALKPDLVLFPGDIVDDEVKSYSDQGIDEVISKIQSTYGVYVSLGNHDLGDTAELIDVLHASNMKVLYDETTVVADSLTLVGRKDRYDQERMSLAELMEGVDPSKPVILLDHQPYELGVAEKEGVDLMVSGHTHRGQLAPFQFITQQIYENDWGYFQKGSLHSVVTSGFGFWGPPLRTNSRSEIVQIHLSY